MPPRPQRQARTQPPAWKPEAEGDQDSEYTGLIQVVRDMLKTERLHVPQPIEATVVEAPFDLTKLSDQQIQKLYSAFTAYSYRVGYLLMEHEARASKCKEAADEIVTWYIAEADDDGETLTKMKAQAEQHDQVKKWRRRQKTNNVLADAQRKQRDNYDKVCERLSRLETMRMNEWTREGGGNVGKSPSSRPGSK